MILPTTSDIEEPATPEVVVMPDGGLLITDAEPTTEYGDLQNAPFDANLVDVLPEGDVRTIGMEACEAVEQDDRSRDEWKQIIKDGIELLGFENKPKTDPFAGACGVTYPMIAEAAIRFQARAVIELFPEAGPADCVVVGQETPERRAQADRVKDYLNYHLTEVDRGYLPDFDQMLFDIATHGTAFRKVWYDPTLRHVTARWVLADDLIVSYGAPNIRAAPRITHVLRYTPNEVRRMQLAGAWRDVALTPVGQEADVGPIAQKTNEITGVAAPADDKQARREIYEIHGEFDIPGDDRGQEAGGLLLPYVVTVDKETQTVLAIRRNWREDDDLFRARQNFVQYVYIAGRGCYGLGLLHIVGGLARGATALLRELVDAGQLANLPGGFKMRGAKPERNNTPIGFGEWREIDTMGIPVAQAFAPLPYKEPSATLFNLFNGLIESGQRLASVTDMNVGDGSTQQPVGTVMAMQEQALLIQSAVHKRLHASQGEELRLIAEMIRDHMPEGGYPYQTDAQGPQVMAQDFDGRVDVIPVSDPKNFTAVQRQMKSAMLMQMAASAPELYLKKELHKRALRDSGIDDADSVMTPDPPQPKPSDPVTENLMALNGMPLAVRPGQDHAAHCDSHMAMLHLPMAMQQPWGAVLLRHTVEHELWKVWAELNARMGGQLPPLGQQMPPQAEAILAQAGQARMQQVIAALNAKMPQMGMQSDPAAIQAATNAKEVALKDEREREKLRLDAEKHNDTTALKYTEIALDTAMAQQQQVQQAQEAQTDRVMRIGEAQAAREHEASTAMQDRHMQIIEGEQSRQFDSAEQERSRRHQAEQSERDRAMTPPPMPPQGV